MLVIVDISGLLAVASQLKESTSDRSLVSISCRLLEGRITSGIASTGSPDRYGVGLVLTVSSL